MVATIDAPLHSSLLFAFVCNRKLAKNEMQSMCHQGQNKLESVDPSAELVLLGNIKRDVWQRSALVYFVDCRASLPQRAELHGAEAARFREVIRYQI
uniref:Uncharacterized protein n=1 Tax=Ixodes ricinus TaxID=34613 RepID=A0A6B0UDL4_IXORI